MYVRLAFAVAAHLEPEILIVDEVLAVGDAEFQKKCLGKMQDVASGSGRTVLFVSHNINAVKRVCGKGLTLANGRLMAFGSIETAIAARSEAANAMSYFTRGEESHADAQVRKAHVHEEWHGDKQHLHFFVSVSSQREMKASIDLQFRDKDGAPVAYVSFGTVNPKQIVEFRRGDSEFSIVVDASVFARGIYLVSISIIEPFIRVIDRVEDCMSFSYTPDLAPKALGVFDQQWGDGSIKLDGLIKQIS
jgi:lipopolysaccharide transport system ATP-binding protein